LKAATTKRYYVKTLEVEEALELEGKIEDIHKVTPYEKDQDVELKDVDFVITTVIDVEEQVEKLDRGAPAYLDRHIN